MKNFISRIVAILKEIGKSDRKTVINAIGYAIMGLAGLVFFGGLRAYWSSPLGIAAVGLISWCMVIFGYNIHRAALDDTPIDDWFSRRGEWYKKEQP